MNDVCFNKGASAQVRATALGIRFLPVKVLEDIFTERGLFHRDTFTERGLFPRDTFTERYSFWGRCGQRRWTAWPN